MTGLISMEADGAAGGVEVLRSAGKGCYPAGTDEASEALHEARAADACSPRIPTSYAAKARSLLDKLGSWLNSASDDDIERRPELQWLWPPAMPRCQRWVLPSAGGAWGKAPLCAGGGHHNGLPPSDARPGSVLYTGEAPYQLSEAMRWLQQNNPSADDPWWTAATKKRLRGVDARVKSDSTLLRELGVVKGSCISVEIPARFPVNSDGVRWRDAPVPDDPATAGSVDVTLVLTAEEAAKRGVDKACIVYVNLDTPQSALKQQVAALLGSAVDHHHAKLGFVIDRRIAWRPQYEDTRVNREANKDITSEECKRLEAQLDDDKNITLIAMYLLKDLNLVAEIGERLLVDLELAFTGPESPVCRKFWDETAHQWIPGMTELDRSVLAFVRDLPVLEEAWKAAGYETATSRARHVLVAATVSTLVDFKQWTSLTAQPQLFTKPSELRNELQARREVVKLPQTMDELVECLQYTGRIGPLKRKIPKHVMNVGQLKGGVDACLELSEREKAAAMVRLQAIQDDRFDRMRFQNHLVEGLLRKDDDPRGCGILDSTQKLDDVAAKEMLDSSSPAVFSRQFANTIDGAGPLAALKVASELQIVGYFPKDDLPPIGEGESAYCAIRAAAHTVLTGKATGACPTWLKKAPRTKKRAKGETMDERVSPRPIQHSPCSRSDTRANVRVSGVRPTHSSTGSQGGRGNAGAVGGASHRVVGGAAARR